MSKRFTGFAIVTAVLAAMACTQAHAHHDQRPTQGYLVFWQGTMRASTGPWLDSSSPGFWKKAFLSKFALTYSVP